MFNKNVAIAYPNFKFSFTIWMLGRAHKYLEELREKSAGVKVNGTLLEKVKGEAESWVEVKVQEVDSDGDTDGTGKTNGKVNGNGYVANGNGHAVATNGHASNGHVKTARVDTSA